MANTNGDSFVFYKSFYSAFSALESIEHGKGSEYIEALCKFAFDGIVPETDDKIMQAFYDAFVPQLEANRIKKANGKKGGRPKNNQRLSKEKTSGYAKEKPNVNENVNVNVNENVNGNKIKRFTPPTLEEVKAYCLESGYRIDAERFIDYYESNGWMVGRNKMKDWKAAVRNWSKREDEKPKKEERRDPYEDVDFSWLREIHQVGG